MNQQEPIKTTGHTNSLIAAGTSGLVGAYAAFFFEGAKKRLQSNQPLPSLQQVGMKTWFKESFRGSSSFAGSLVPTSIIQQMTSHYFQEQNLSYTMTGKMLETVFSGSLGGMASTIVENIVLEQQLHNTGPKQAFFNLLTQGHTRIFRGLPLVMTREAIFGFCYLKGANEAGNYATTHFGAAYALPAQLCVGALGSLISHPFDTVATTMQHKGYKKTTDAAMYLWNENKAYAFYKGGAARIGLFTTAMLTIGKVQKVVLDKLNDQPENSVGRSQMK